MQLLIKQRVFSWTDTYDVYDEHENPKYFVKAEFFALGHQIHVYDKSGKRETFWRGNMMSMRRAVWRSIFQKSRFNGAIPM